VVCVLVDDGEFTIDEGQAGEVVRWFLSREDTTALATPDREAVVRVEASVRIEGT